MAAVRARAARSSEGFLGDRGQHGAALRRSRLRRPPRRTQGVRLLRGGRLPEVVCDLSQHRLLRVATGCRRFAQVFAQVFCDLGLDIGEQSGAERPAAARASVGFQIQNLEGRGLTRCVFFLWGYFGKDAIWKRFESRCNLFQIEKAEEPPPRKWNNGVAEAFTVQTYYNNLFSMTKIL